MLIKDEYTKPVGTLVYNNKVYAPVTGVAGISMRNEGQYILIGSHHRVKISGDTTTT